MDIIEKDKSLRKNLKKLLNNELKQKTSKHININNTSIIRKQNKVIRNHSPKEDNIYNVSKLVETLRIAFMRELSVKKLSDRALDLYLGYFLSRALKNNIRFKINTIFKIEKSIHENLTNNNLKFALRALQQYVKRANIKIDISFSSLQKQNY